MSDDVVEARPTQDQAPSGRMQERLAAADQDLLRRREPDAQVLRRALIREATVAIVGVGWPSKRLIYERAAELGVRLILIDRRGHWSEELVSEGIAVAFVPLDPYVDVAGQVEEVLEGLASLSMPIDGVCTFWEDDVPVVARVARRLGLPGNSPVAADRARSKLLTMLATQEGGIPTPRFLSIDHVGTLDRAPSSVGFPAVLKPEFGSSAMGVYRVDSEPELVAAYARIVSLLPTWDPVFTEYGADLLLEEYLDGTEFDIDLLFSEGRCVYASVSENWPTDEPYFYETGLHAPSGFPHGQLEEMIDLSVRATQALGLTLGVFHVEGKYTSRGARIVEINARMGGSTVRDANLMIHGVDLVEEHLMATVGIPIHPVESEQPMCGVSNIFIYAEQTGTITSTEFVDRFKADPRVFFAEPGVHAGGRVLCAADGFPTLLIEVALRDKDAASATEAIRELASSVTISYS